MSYFVYGAAQIQVTEPAMTMIGHGNQIAAPGGGRLQDFCRGVAEDQT